ncbi:MAG TPA: SRPBCC family protein [Candidatus Limnocylindria bacterium]|nr:SRPBCC family protein [Candidatus Limnocylindria bacterium]
MTDPVVVSLSVAAPPETVYGLVADLARMSEWSPETTEIRWLDGATQAQVGARFRGTNRNGFRRWNTICTVVTAVPGIELSWRSSSFGLSVALWTYRFTADGESGTTVTESTQDERGALMRLLAPLATGVRDRAAHNEDTMLATLQRLKGEAERSSA